MVRVRKTQANMFSFLPVTYRVANYGEICSKVSRSLCGKVIRNLATAGMDMGIAMTTLSEWSSKIPSCLDICYCGLELGHF